MSLVSLLTFAVIISSCTAYPTILHRVLAGFNNRAPSPMFSTNTSIYNVLDYGAIANGTGENVIAFQNALNQANTRKGGIVYVPPGQYQFQTATPLNIPKGVTLLGSHGNVPSQANQVGSVLLMKGGMEDINDCFITLGEDSTFSGFYIYYPNQRQDQTPKPYAWSVCMSGNNPAVTDLQCINCWNAIQVTSASRHYLARIQGQPINIGIYIQKTVDVGTIEDVHFRPWYTTIPNFMKWQLQNGRAFVFAGSNWEYVSNTFASGYAIGYHFMESNNGKNNGYFVGIGADECANASVQVDSSEVTGILISNGRFTAYVGQNWGRTNADSTQVLVSNTSEGNVQFSNSAFWGPSNHIAKIYGKGTVSFTQCIFNTWDKSKKGYSAIMVDKNATGSLIVQGNDFQMDSVGPQVELGDENLSKAVITGNLIKGLAKITGKAKSTQIGLNADDQE